jgi:hypothetical protein
MKHEYRTKPISRLQLLAELAAACEAFSLKGLSGVEISFGWDSNLPLDDMWKSSTVLVGDVLSFVGESEKSGVVEIGKGDVFIEVPEFMLTLCHESDAHVSGDSDLVEKFFRRWEASGYDPYEVREPTK